MKVLIVSFYYKPEMGAAPSRITNLAEGLQKQGFDVDILTCLPNYPKGSIFKEYKGRFYKKETINDVNIYRYWTYATISKSGFKRLLGMLFFAIAVWLFGLRFRKIRKYDRVIVQSPPILVAYSALLLFKCLYRRFTILNVSDLWPLSAIELGALKEGSTSHRILLRMERFVYKHASAWQGQSEEIISHISASGFEKPRFLYRNLQPQSVSSEGSVSNRQVLRIVYAGLLGVAQDILGIIKDINFKDIGAELHIYGGGNQAHDIQQYIEQNDCGVYFHDFQPKEVINATLGQYHASIVPLAVRIKGAVPSKIFDLLPHGTPILFAGGGEGEKIIIEHQLGFVSAPGDNTALKENILGLKNLSDEAYEKLRSNCLSSSQKEFSFEKQIERYTEFLKNCH